MDRRARGQHRQAGAAAGELPASGHRRRRSSSYPPFATDDSQGLQEALQAGQSYLEFIQKLADRLDFEVFLEFADLDTRRRRSSSTSSRVAAARSRTRSCARSSDSIASATCSSSHPTIKVVDQYSEVEVRGRHRDPLLAAARSRGAATHTILDDELHPTRARRRPSAVGTRGAGSKFFQGRENKFTIPNQSNLDDVRARLGREGGDPQEGARAVHDRGDARSAMPRLRPGHHVEIRGMRPPFDGFFYVTQDRPHLRRGRLPHQVHGLAARHGASALRRERRSDAMSHARRRPARALCAAERAEPRAAASTAS